MSSSASGQLKQRSCGGIIAGILRVLLEKGGICVWISYTRRIYPPELKRFVLEPDHVIFVDVPLQKGVLWVMEEALKCQGVAAVVCQTHCLSFMESRRCKRTLHYLWAKLAIKFNKGLDILEF